MVTGLKRPVCSSPSGTLGRFTPERLCNVFVRTPLSPPDFVLNVVEDGDVVDDCHLFPIFSRHLVEVNQEGKKKLP